MSYKGNAKSALIFPTNTRVDLVPDGIVSTFNLGMEVPGGYEGNILVIRRQYIEDVIVSGSIDISFDGTLNKVICSSNDSLAAKLADFKPFLSGIYNGDNITISGAALPNNNDTFQVTNVVYDGYTIEITVNGNLDTEAAGNAITVTRGYPSPWEVLEPEIDYTIGGVGPNLNKEITLSKIPSTQDVVYVIFKGDATYNFVPSPNSVTPDALQQNLRNFTCDRFTGDGTTTDFVLSQEAVSSKSLLVTVNGSVLDGNDDVFLSGDWELNTAGDTVSFNSAPSNGADIRVLHLGFSTISRRAALSPGQVGAVPPNSINTPELGNLAVTTAKLDNDAVNGSKLLLNNEENVRAKKADTSPTGILRINSSDKTVLMSVSDFILERNGSNLLTISASDILPEVTNVLSLGSALKRFKDLFLSGDANITGTLTTTGDLTTGLVNGVDVASIPASITAAAIPVGTCLPYGGTSVPDSNYLMADGSVVSQAAHPALFAVIGTNYNIGGEGVGNFRLPDLRQRFLLGKAASGTGSVLGEYGGLIDHTHTTPNHSHTFTHTHGLPAHYHEHNPTNGSNLRIGIPSGNHTTSISHTHSSFSTSVLEGSHLHLINPFSGMTTDAQGSHDHQTYGQVNGNPVSNGVNVPAPYNGVNQDIVGGGTVGTISQSQLVRTSTVSSHNHTVYGTIGPSGTHQHTISVPAFTGNSSSTGEHTHPSNTFTGFIGNLNSGNNGDNTLNTISQSSNTTPVSGAGVSGASNPPYVVFNFIIRRA